MTAYAALRSPITIRGTTFRNRLFSSGHVPGYTPEGYPNDRYVAYNTEKAKGGIGLITFGGSTNIARDSVSLFGGLTIRDDAVIPHYRRLADAVHEHGAGIMCQITHMGRHCRWDFGDWIPLMGVSQIRDPGGGRSLAREMKARDIRRAIGDYVAGARRCAEAGLDGVEIISSMHLPGQFLSPLSNRRSDEYGGSLENRARFLLEVLAACRDAVADDFIIGVRLTADESNEGGISAEEGIEAARLIGTHGAADFINVNGAYSGTATGVNVAFPGMEAKSAPYVELARKVREASGLVTMQASRLDTLSTANHAIESGCLDMAGMTRPHIADPHLLLKVERDEEHRIRPCVGAGYCLDRPYRGLDALCMHNPSSGREVTLPHLTPKASTPLRAIVVGGGPGGMEAARVLAERGHAVTLMEAADRLGGQLVLAARASWRRGLQGVVDWLSAELEHLNVDVVLNRFVNAEDVQALRADIVILATGGLPLTYLAEGGEEHVMTTWDVLGENKRPSGSVLLYDQVGAHAVLSCAEVLTTGGAALTLVTPDALIGQDLGAQNKPVYMRNLLRAGARLLTDIELLGVHAEGNRLIARLRNRWTREVEHQAFDAIVVDQGIEHDESLFDALAPGARNEGRLDLDALCDNQPQPEGNNDAGTYQLYRIGDALMSRDCHAAIYEARRLCQLI